MDADSILIGITGDYRFDNTEYINGYFVGLLGGRFFTYLKGGKKKRGLFRDIVVSSSRLPGPEWSAKEIAKLNKLPFKEGKIEDCDAVLVFTKYGGEDHGNRTIKKLRELKKKIYTVWIQEIEPKKMVF